jgi:hypothetical protein
MAYSFGSGNTNIISYATGLNIGFSAFSISAVIKPNSANTANRQIVELFGASGSDIWFMFDSSGTNRVAFGFGLTGGTYPEVKWTSGFGAGTEHVLIAVYDGSTQRIYADTDATHKATNSASGNLISATATGDFIGNVNVGGTRSWDGTLAEVAIWDRALTEAERLALGNRFSPRFFPRGLVRYAPLIRASHDLAGGRAGTVTGATVVPHPRVILPTWIKIPGKSASTPITVQPSALSAVFSIQTPTPKTDAVISPSTQSVTVSTQAPSVSGGASVSPSAQVATFAVQTLVVSLGTTVSVSAQAATFTTQAPTVQLDFTVSANTQVATASLQSPAINLDYVVSPVILQATFTTALPTVSLGATVESAVQETTISVQSLAVSTTSVIAAAVQEAAFSVVSPDVAAGVTAAANAVAATFSIQDTTANCDQVVSVAVQAASFSIPAPNAGGGILVAVNAQSLSLTPQPVTVLYGQTVAAGVVSSIFSIGSVVVSISTMVQAAVRSAVFALQNIVVNYDWRQIVSVLQVTLFPPTSEVVIVDRIYPYARKSSPYSNKTSPYGRQTPYTPLV